MVGGLGHVPEITGKSLKYLYVIVHLYVSGPDTILWSITYVQTDVDNFQGSEKHKLIWTNSNQYLGSAQFNDAVSLMSIATHLAKRCPISYDALFLDRDLSFNRLTGEIPAYATAPKYT